MSSTSLATTTSTTTTSVTTAGKTFEPKGVTATGSGVIADSVNPSDMDNTCVVCFKNVEIFSIGECDHPVCYECSTRMRVLCKQNECPICRTDMSKVIFTIDKNSFRQLEISNRTGLYDKKHRISFASLRFQEAYYKLLENPCSKCNQGPFPSFAALRDHVKRKHEEFYCDICTDNLSVFSFERKSYNRTNLGIHRRKGDPDDKSHRGHPLCEYCDTRFFDRDELYKHLRREHFYCHFCDADGANCYYADYAELTVHFRREHYLCEDGACAQEQFTAVFRTEIDLKAHIASHHGQGLNRQAAKQIRTLEFEITLAPRNRPNAGGGGGQNGSGGSGGPGPSGYRQRQYNGDSQSEFDMLDHTDRNTIFQQPQRVIDAKNEQEFPSLAGTSGNPTASFSLRPNVSLRTQSYGTSGLARTKENFPALGGSSVPEIRPTNITSSKQAKTSDLLKKNNNKSSAGQLSNTQKQPGMVIHVSNRPSTSASTTPSTKSGASKKSDSNRDKDFPSLPGSNGGGNSKRANLEQDFIPPSISAYSNNIAAKHRSMVEGYEQVAAAAVSKLALVERSINEAPKTPSKENVPKLNSRSNFPALGNTPAAASSPQWVMLSKKPATESRKNKVAPPPLAISNVVTEIGSKTTISNNGKKETNKTTTKPVNKLNNEKSISATTAIIPPSTPTSTNPIKINNKKQNANKSQQQQQQQQNYDDLEPEYVPSPTVFQAVSAKHRSLVDNYESVKPNAMSKLSVVHQRDNDATNTVNKQQQQQQQTNLLKLNSKNMFPSLSGGDDSKPVGNNTTNSNTINYMNILKNTNNNNNNNTTNNNNNKTNNKNSNSNGKSNKQNNNNMKNSNVIGQESSVLGNMENITINGPPPGYMGSSGGDSNSPATAPPGFKSVTLNSVAKSSNNLTFTTSSGESFSILPSLNKYLPPPNAILRNKALFALFQSTILNSDVVDSFKQVSQLFINGQYNALPYYEHCQAALTDKFESIFPELLVLLPDIGKQQELYLVHTQQQLLIQPINESEDSPKMNYTLNLEVCSICKQVLTIIDLPIHLQSHELESNFPTLK